MDNQEFKIIIANLQDEYNVKMTNEKINRWWQILRGFSFDAANKAIFNCISTYKFFPSLAEFKKEINACAYQHKLNGAHPKLLSGQKEPPLVRGVSDLQDLLISKLEKMQKNMPDYMQRVRECETLNDKLTMCCVALGEPELMSNPVMVMLGRKSKKRQEGLNNAI